MNKLGENIKKHAGFIWALAVICASLVGVYVASCFGVHPYTVANPQYHKLWVLFLIGVLFGLVCLIILAVNLFLKPLTKKPDMVRTCTIIVAVLAFTYIFIMPPMSSADDIRHYLTAYKLSNQMMFKTAVDENNHVYMRAEDAEILLNDFPGSDDYYRMVTELTGSVDSTPVAFTAEEPLNVLFIAYIPSAIGITLARLLGLRQIALLLLGRFFSVVFFVAFFALAMKKLPFGREVLMFICCLPMTLNTVASFSYDVVVLALCFYFIAYVLHLSFMAEKVTVKDMVILTVTFAIMAPIKVVYILLAFIMFLIPRSKFGSTRKYIISAVSMVLVVGIFFLLQRLGTLADYVENEDPYLAYADTNVYSFSFLLHNPATTFKIFINTFHVWGGSWFEDMLGYRLGWQDVELPELIVACFGMLGCFAAVKPAEEPVYFKTSQRTVTLVTAAVTAAMVMVTMLVVYTPEGATFIYGVQGRYFLPMLPLFMLGIRSDAVRRRETSGKWVIFSCAVLNYWAIGCVIATVMSRTGVTKMLAGN